MEKVILEKINLKIEKLKTKIKRSFTNHILSDPGVLAYIGTLHRKYVIVLIDKASNIFGFICKKFYISKIFSEVGEYNSILYNPTYSKANLSKDHIIKNNENYCQKFDLKRTAKNCFLPIIYWLPKFHKTPVGATILFIIFLMFYQIVLSPQGKRSGIYELFYELPNDLRLRVLRN